MNHDTRPTRRHLLQWSMFGVAAAAAPGITRVAARSIHDHGTPAASPVASPQVPASDQPMLAVADPIAGLLSIFTMADNTPIGSIEGVSVQTHAGFLPLANGTLLFVNEQAHELVAIGKVGNTIEIVGRAKLPGDAVSHIAVDSDHAHLAAVGTNAPNAPIVLVDLETWATTPIALPEFGEVGFMLNHDILFHRNDKANRIEAYAIDQLLTGVIAPLSTVEIGPGGHGESIDLVNDMLYSATDEGVEVVSWDGANLTYVTTYAWDTEDRKGGRGYFQRLTADGSHVISYTANRVAPESEWETWTNDVWIADTKTNEVIRTELGSGYTFRFALAGQSALFSLITGTGDAALIVDLDPASPTFGTVVKSIPLEPMSSGPKPGSSIYTANQFRSLAAMPVGTHGEIRGFVSQGGDGLVVEIDMQQAEIATTIQTPASLDTGGHLGVFGTPECFTDTIGR